MAINCDCSLRYNRNLLKLSLLNNAIYGREGYCFRNFRGPLHFGRNFNYGNYYGRGFNNRGYFNYPGNLNDLWYFYNAAVFNNPSNGNEED